MLKKTILATAMAAGLTVSMSAQASSFGIYDPRSLGMGGVGVTTATSRNASFFNPAALAATHDGDNFSFNVTAAFRAADPDKMIDELSDVEDAGNEVSNALNALNSSIDTIINAGVSLTQPQVDQGASDATRSSNAITVFNAAIQKINNKSVEIGAAAGMILSIPSKSVGVGLYGGGRADVGAKLNYSASDATQLTNSAATAATISTTLAACDVSTPATCNVDALRDSVTDTSGELVGLTSTFDARGAMVSEIGLSFARRFKDFGNVDIGITPKAVKVKTFNYSVSAQDSEIDADKGQLEQSGFTFDLGVTKSYGENYKAGIVVKNVIGKKFDFADPASTTGGVIAEKYEIKPQTRLGLSHHTNWTTVGLDVDLTKNKGLGAGFSKDTQFVAIGAELDVWLLQLRLGYRHDLAGNYDGMPSVGVAFNLFGLHVDVGAAGTDKEAAASVQVGFNF